MVCRWCGQQISSDQVQYCPGCGRALAPGGNGGGSYGKNPPRAGVRGKGPRQTAGRQWDSYRNPNAWLKWAVLAVVLTILFIGGVVLFSVVGLHGKSLWELVNGTDPSEDWMPDTVYGEEIPLPEPVSEPAESTAPEKTEPLPAVQATDTQVVLHNVLFKHSLLTINGEPASTYTLVGQDIVLERSQLPDLAQIRIISPDGEGWQTAAVWYNYLYGNELTFGDAGDYGPYQSSDSSGLADPSVKVIDVLTWAYYRGYLDSINKQSANYMLYSTLDNTNRQKQEILSEASRRMLYDLGDFTAVCDPGSIQYDGTRVRYNAKFRTVGTDRESNKRQQAYSYRTIELLWQDGVWKVDKVASLREAEYLAGTYAALP